MVGLWAAARGVPVYGVDWEDLEMAASSARRWIASLRAADTLPPRTLAQAHADALRVARLVERSLGGDAADYPENVHRQDWFTWIKSGTRNTAPIVREFWASASREDAGGRTARALGARDDRIVHQVLTLIRRYRNARLPS